jgi:uncharacterized pyridoxamine 5'-phosphate oxidase family protein
VSESMVPRPEVPVLGYPPDNPELTPWDKAEAVLTDSKTYWLATTQEDGRPHVMPVWGVWLDNKFYFSTSPASRKGKNLARDPRCTINLSGDGLDLVVEGTAAISTDAETATRVAELYGPKYEWPVTARDGGIYGENGDGGPLYVLTPTVAFGFGLEGGFSATRWKFR